MHDTQPKPSSEDRATGRQQTVIGPALGLAEASTWGPVVRWVGGSTETREPTRGVAADR